MPVQSVSSRRCGRALRWGAPPALLFFGLFSCSGGDERPRPAENAGGASGSSDAGGQLGTGGKRDGGAGARDGGADGSATGGSAGSGPEAGAAGTNGDAGGRAGTSGADGGAEASVCGNGIQEGDEPCDGSDFGGQSCLSFGFDQGSLACAGCSIDLRGCSGKERCSDGRDNDGDFIVDCMDPDCAQSCSTSCATPTELTDPATAVRGATNGHAAELSPSCLLPASARDASWSIGSWPRRPGCWTSV